LEWNLPSLPLGQKASAAKGFIKATETLRKKPQITLKSLFSTKNVFKKPRNPSRIAQSFKKPRYVYKILILIKKNLHCTLKISFKSRLIFTKASHF
jgi:hypothetical protein